MLVEGRSVDERSMAIDAEVLGYERLRLLKASRAHRYARRFCEGITADAALVRIDKRKERGRYSTQANCVDDGTN
jgi:hypothetical protein